MIEVLGAIASGVFTGGATGLIGVLLQRFFDFKAKRLEVDLVKLNHENALALRTLELDRQERIAVRTAEADELIAQTEAQAREAEAAERTVQASYEADRATYLTGAAQQQSRAARILMALADFARGIIRPLGTVYLMAVTTAMFWWTTKLAGEYGVKMTADQVLQLQMNLIGTITYCFTTSWVWWFGVRPAQPKGR